MSPLPLVSLYFVLRTGRNLFTATFRMFMAPFKSAFMLWCVLVQMISLSQSELLAETDLQFGFFEIP